MIYTVSDFRLVVAQRCLYSLYIKHRLPNCNYIRQLLNYCFALLLCGSCATFDCAGFPRDLFVSSTLLFSKLKVRVVGVPVLYEGGTVR
jgi:hypothetical protein